MAEELNEAGRALMAALARDNLTGADCLYWSCELCGATPGVPCRTASGAIVPTLLSHKSRRDQCGRWNRWHIDYPGAELGADAEALAYAEYGAAEQEAAEEHGGRWIGPLGAGGGDRE